MSKAPLQYQAHHWKLFQDSRLHSEGHDLTHPTQGASCQGKHSLLCGNCPSASARQLASKFFGLSKMPLTEEVKSEHLGQLESSMGRGRILPQRRSNHNGGDTCVHQSPAAGTLCPTLAPRPLLQTGVSMQTTATIPGQEQPFSQRK